MRAVEDLNAGSLVCRVERERDGAQRRGEFLIGKAGDEDLAIDVGEIGDRFHTRAGASARLRFGRGRIGEGNLGVLHAVELDFLELAGSIKAQENGRRLRPAPARDAEIDFVRYGVDGDVINYDLIGRGAEQRGNLFVCGFQIDGYARGGFIVIGIDGEDCAAHGVACKEYAIGSEG